VKHIPTQDERTADWKEKLLGTPYAQQWQVTLQEEPNVKRLKQAMRSGQAVAVSDISFVKGRVRQPG